MYSVFLLEFAWFFLRETWNQVNQGENLLPPVKIPMYRSFSRQTAPRLHYTQFLPTIFVGTRTPPPTPPSPAPAPYIKARLQSKPCPAGLLQPSPVRHLQPKFPSVPWKIPDISFARGENSVMRGENSGKWAKIYYKRRKLSYCVGATLSAVPRSTERRAPAPCWTVPFCLSTMLCKLRQLSQISKLILILTPSRGPSRGSCGLFRTTSSRCCGMSAAAWVQRSMGATEWVHWLERGSVNAQIECYCMNANILIARRGWVNAARICMWLRKCSSRMSRFLAMLEYWDSWHFCLNIHGTDTCWKVTYLMIFLAINAIKQKIFQTAINAENIFQTMLTVIQL